MPRAWNHRKGNQWGKQSSGFQQLVWERADWKELVGVMNVPENWGDFKTTEVLKLWVMDLKWWTLFCVSYTTPHKSAQIKGEKRFFKKHYWTFLVAQWLRTCLPMQGTRVWSLVREDPTCCRATKSVCHNYWAAFWSLRVATTESMSCSSWRPPTLEPVPCKKRSRCNEKPSHRR